MAFVILVGMHLSMIVQVIGFDLGRSQRRGKTTVTCQDRVGSRLCGGPRYPTVICQPCGFSSSY
jgi:hypothetical protein